jgi:hypothetical protein
MASPALPWGAVAGEGAKRDRPPPDAADAEERAEKQRKTEEEGARDMSALAAVGLYEGARMEVQWNLADDDAEDAVTAHVRTHLSRHLNAPP